eukprot:9426564-Heterocapsa_arctica.AAC.1
MLTAIAPSYPAAPRARESVCDFGARARVARLSRHCASRARTCRCRLAGRAGNAVGLRQPRTVRATARRTL